ncbi:transposase [Streptomyces noursei]|uniref:transposase n=1 Tax=Streptomyces noursei TaxID=1971 RepID=UPI0033D312E9
MPAGRKRLLLRGLTLNGRREAIPGRGLAVAGRQRAEPAAFLNQSAWEPVPTQRRIAEWMLPLIGPMAWVIDDVSVPKDGRMPGRGGPAVLRCTGNRRTVRACIGSGSLGEMISFRWQAET